MVPAQLKYAERMIAEGTAFCDDTSGEDLQAQRMALQDSPNRNNRHECGCRAAMKTHVAAWQ